MVSTRLRVIIEVIGMNVRLRSDSIRLAKPAQQPRRIVQRHTQQEQQHAISHFAILSPEVLVIWSGLRRYLR